MVSVAAALGGTGGLGKGGKRKRRTRGRFILARIEEIKPQTDGIESGRNQTRFLEIKQNEFDWLRGFVPLVLLFLFPQESKQMVEVWIRFEFVFEFISKNESEIFPIRFLSFAA